MAVVYTKQITGLQAYKDIDGLMDVVFQVSWNLIGEENGYTSSCPAMTNVPYIAGQPFTPFSELTESEVISWVDAYTPLAQLSQLQNSVTFSLQQQQQLDSPPLPWGPQPVTPTWTLSQNQ